MNLRSLLVSSDEATVRILRRVLSDLEIAVEHSSAPEPAIRQLTRHRFEAIIVDASNPDEARDVMRSAKAAPSNSRALTIVLVEAALGLKGGFEMGAHFVLHKPLTRERARSSFRAVRALMKRERRRQVRVAVQIPVDCSAIGSATRYSAKTLDICEGGMAIEFAGRVAKESALRFTLNLPNVEPNLDLVGELAWDGGGRHAGVRFTQITEQQRAALRRWLNSQLPEPEQDDPPVRCQLTDLTLGGCYLETLSPFPAGTRVNLSLRSADLNVRAAGIVRVMHPEYGMGVEFWQNTPEQRDQVHEIIEALRSKGETSAELLVEPEGLEAGSTTEDNSAEGFVAASDDLLVELFRHHAQVPVEIFLQQMRQQRQAAAGK